MKTKRFSAYSLLWILAAVILIAAMTLAVCSRNGYKSIEFRSPAPATPSAVPTEEPKGEYILVLNESTKKIHLPDCRYAKSMADGSRKEVSADDIDEATAQLQLKGYSICRVCMAKDEK